MTADLTILPVGGNAHLGTVLADVLKAVRRQGITYQLTGTTTCLEGSWEQIVATARQCHDVARSHAPHVVTMLRIEDDIEGHNDLQSSIEAVKDLAEENFNSRPPAEAPPMVKAEAPPARSTRA
ncbi:MAG TPA: thiamine-binding protein [Opitutaceae bacterium]|nr:thiamine-binding protein [Opitutaceae bacterium]